MEVIYSNAQKIMHTENEFYFDFYQLSEDVVSIEEGKPLVRVYMTAQQVMRFRDAIEKNVGSYIEKYVKPLRKIEEKK